MNEVSSWQNFIASFTGVNASQSIHEDATKLVDLSHLGLIAVPGEDSTTFLQGQLSCDLMQLNNAHCLIGSLNTQKGRAVSTLTLAMLNDTVHLLLHKSLVADVIQVLNKYIVFSKAALETKVDEIICLGVCGKQADTLVAKLLPLPENSYDINHNEHLHCIKIPGTTPRYILLGDFSQAQSAWTSLSKDCVIADLPVWENENIKAGIAEVTAPTKEQFLPHNLNLHLTGAVNFEKGCYTGQEVIARMHYRGKLKSELLICELIPFSGETPPALPLNGTAIQTSTEEKTRNLGEIINATVLASGKIMALALLPKKDNLEEFLRQVVVINSQEFNLNRVERPPYAINNK